MKEIMVCHVITSFFSCCHMVKNENSVAFDDSLPLDG
jgi:hypothetical protein